MLHTIFNNNIEATCSYAVLLIALVTKFHFAAISHIRLQIKIYLSEVGYTSSFGGNNKDCVC